MDGETYEQWVAGIDIDTGRKKGRVRDDANALRFVEVTVNGPKTWSLAAALHPDISAALDEAQDKAAAEIVGWVAQHATTRVGTARSPGAGAGREDRGCSDPALHVACR